MKSFNEIYKEMELDESDTNLEKLKLYTLCRYKIEDKEYSDEIINKLYDAYETIVVLHHGDYDIDCFFGYVLDTLKDLETTDINKAIDQIEEDIENGDCDYD